MVLSSETVRHETAVLTNFLFVGMVTAMDDAIGAVMTAFRKHKFTGNLLVVFTTDVSKA